MLTAAVLVLAALSALGADHTAPVRDRITIPIGDIEVAACRLYADGLDLTQPHPVVLEWTNYTIESENAGPTAGCPPQGQKLADLLVPQGFVYVAANTRGVGRTGGAAAQQWSTQDGIDGAAVVEWLGEQPWSNGHVGLYGCSSSAMEGWQVVVRNPPHLGAAALACFADDAYRGAFYLGGMRNWTVWTFLARLGVDVDYEGGQLQEAIAAGDPTPFQRVAGDVAVFGDVMTETTDGPFWREMSVAEEIDGPRPPVYAFGSWSDFFSGAPEFAMRHLQDDDRVLLYPGWHGSGEAVTGEFGMIERTARWLRWHLVDRVEDRRAPDPFAAEAPIVYWVQDGGHLPGAASGPINERFETSPVWPPADVAYQRWYLDGDRSGTSTSTNDGMLTRQSPAPADVSIGDVFTYPVPSAGTTTDPRGFDLPSYAPAALEDAGGALTYTSEPLDAPVTIAGPVTLNLWASSSAPDTDWVVRLLSVAPDGSFQDVTNGWQKASHRTLDPQRTLYDDRTGDVIRPYLTHVDPMPVPVGEPVNYAIELWQTATEVPAGHRLRLFVSSQSVPWFLQEIPPAVNRVLRDVAHPSYLLLPVVTPDDPSCRLPGRPDGRPPAPICG